MRINKSDSINFKSNYQLVTPLNKTAGEELIKDFYLFINPHSPFNVNEGWEEKGVSELLSILDNNDHIVEKYLKQKNILFKKGLSALEYYKKKFSKNVHSNMLQDILAETIIGRKGWKVPKKLLDKFPKIG